MKKGIINFAIKQPWIVIGIAVLITAFFAAQFPDIKIDTDPENMLSEDAPVRVFEHEMKETFGLSDFLAVGIVHEPTAFTPDILNRIYQITADIEEIEGVIVEDITNDPYDLRLQSNTYNEAQDMHTDASGAGLSIPAADIVGTVPFKTVIAVIFATYFGFPANS